jgi:hypothetical protein
MPGSGAPAGGGVLDPQTLDLMLSPMPEARIEMGPYGGEANGLGYAIHPIVLGGDASVVGHDGSNQGWKTAFLALPSEREGLVILTNGEGGGALVDEVKCGWVGWATGRTIPACLEPKLDELGSIAIGVWLVIVLAVMLRLRHARSSARTP